MPQLGEIKHGKDLGLSNNAKYEWRVCPTCEKERWARTAKHQTCRECANKRHSIGMMHDKCWFWKGGRISKANGAIMVMLRRDDFFRSMAQKDGYILEHRLVMAKHLGRCLHRWEIVHHKNGIRDDNRLDNLELGSCNGEHMRMHNQGYQDGYRKGYYDSKDKRIRELLAEIEILKQGIRSHERKS